jgi:hypothetical protein
MLNDQKHRHEPDSHGAKLAKAFAYLRERNIVATQQGNGFRYESAEFGSRVLRAIRQRAA